VESFALNHWQKDYEMGHNYARENARLKKKRRLRAQRRMAKHDTPGERAPKPAPATK
jgi:hypothetical protein